MELKQLQDRLLVLMSEIEKMTAHLNMLIGGREELKLLIANLEANKSVEVEEVIEVKAPSMNDIVDVHC